MKRWVWMVVAVCGVCRISSAADLVSTDFKAAYMPLEELEQKLTKSGLTVVGKHAVAGNEKYTAVIYSSADLKKLGSQPERGFISVLRILHNAEKKELVASNPEYYVRAFYQKKYKDGMADPVMKSLKAALGALTPTDDGLSAKDLSKYNFMMSMPKYDDFARVAKGTPEELSSKLESKAKDRIAFKLDIRGDGSSMLYGVGLPDGIESFNEKLKTMDQSHLLPYMVLIEGGEANILHAKFYLALSFPQLTMTEFMKIMTVPGKIEDAFKADFK
ncbi:hypothetical protein P4B35_02175 [Pontiellaceae bacterium B12227]|nr:hypothetical protein [Pontiellaceae bacterium B12227]